MINVTETAAEKINELLTEEAKTGAGLRVFVQGGGCSGFQYGLMIDEGEGDAESDKVFEVQQAFAKESYEAFVAQMTKMNELYVATAKEAYKPFESSFAAFGIKPVGK